MLNWFQRDGGNSARNRHDEQRLKIPHAFRMQNAQPGCMILNQRIVRCNSG
jgi:hypothetical protein